jgi:hypothetical protein
VYLTMTELKRYVLSHPVGLYGKYCYQQGSPMSDIVKAFDGTELMFVLLLEVTSRR